MSKLPDLAVGLPPGRVYTRNERAIECDSCRVTKQVALAQTGNPNSVKPEKYGDVISSDIVGPMMKDKQLSFGPKPYRYAVCFVDHATKYVMVYPIRYKNDVPAMFEQYMADMAPAGSRDATTFLSRTTGRGPYTSRANRRIKYQGEIFTLIFTPPVVWQQLLKQQTNRPPAQLNRSADGF